MGKPVGKIVAAAAITCGVVFLVTKLVNKSTDVSTLLDKFDFDISINKFKVSGTSLQIGVSVKILNPTKTELSVSKPYLEVIYKADANSEGQKIANTIPSDTEKVTIAAQNYSLVNFTFTIPILSNLGIFKEIISHIIQNVNWTDMMSIPTQISQNIDSIYQYFSISVLIYVGEQGITKTFNLG